MPRIVMKFGGTSMAGIERIRHVAGLRQARGRARQRGRGRGLGDGGRDRPAGPALPEAAPLYDPREYDVVVASGEQVTAGLLAITLSGHGHERALLHGLAAADPRLSGHSAALHRPYRRRACSKTCSTQGGIAVIPGFQGITADGRSRDARPRRLGHLGGRARGRGQGRPLRHLHRRRGRLHHRPAHRPARAQAPGGHL